MNDGFQNYQQRLTRLFGDLSNKHYGSGKQIKLPFYGGYLVMTLEFNNGLINVVEVSAKVLGMEVTSRVKQGYTDTIRLSHLVHDELVRLSKEGQSAEAQLMSNIL